MRFLLIEAYAKVDAWRRRLRNIVYCREKCNKMSPRVGLLNTSLGNNKMPDMLYINIDDMFMHGIFWL